MCVARDFAINRDDIRRLPVLNYVRQPRRQRDRDTGTVARVGATCCRRRRPILLQYHRHSVVCYGQQLSRKSVRRPRQQVAMDGLHFVGRHLHLLDGLVGRADLMQKSCMAPAEGVPVPVPVPASPTVSVSVSVHESWDESHLWTGSSALESIAEPMADRLAEANQEACKANKTHEASHLTGSPVGAARLMDGERPRQISMRRVGDTKPGGRQGPCNKWLYSVVTELPSRVVEVATSTAFFCPPSAVSVSATDFAETRLDLLTKWWPMQKSRRRRRRRQKRGATCQSKQVYSSFIYFQ